MSLIIYSVAVSSYEDFTTSMGEIVTNYIVQVFLNDSNIVDT